MLHFKYRAIDSNSKKVSGIVEDDDITSAASNLRGKNYTILELKEVKVKEEGNDESKGINKEINLDKFFERFSYVSVSTIISFVEQLAYLIESGVSVVQSLQVLETQTSNKKLRKIIIDIRLDIERGQALSDSMAKYPKVFNKMIVNIVKTGEDTGLIDDALKQIATYLEEQITLRRQLLTSLIYPSIILIVTIGVIVFMVYYVIPKLLPFIEMGGGQMAGTTQLLIDASDYLRENYDMILAVIAGLILLLIIVYKNKKGKYYVDKLKMKIPVVGMVFKYSAIIKMTRTLSILIGSGVSIVPALESTSEVVENEVIKQSILDMAKSVLSGESLSTPIKESKGLYPPIVESLIRVGEETGGVHNSLVTLSEIFNKMFQNRVRLINILIEPLLLLVMGGMVAFVAGALISGILSSYGQF